MLLIIVCTAQLIWTFTSPILTPQYLVRLVKWFLSVLVTASLLQLNICTPKLTATCINAPKNPSILLHQSFFPSIILAVFCFLPNYLTSYCKAVNCHLSYIRRIASYHDPIPHKNIKQIWSFPNKYSTDYPTVLFTFSSPSHS